MDTSLLLTGLGLLGIGLEIAIIHRLLRWMELRFSSESSQYRRTKISVYFLGISSVILLVYWIYFSWVANWGHLPGPGMGIQAEPEVFPLLWSAVAPLAACLTALGSIISMVASVTVALRKDRRESRLAELELERRRLELERERLAMEGIKATKASR